MHHPHITSIAHRNLTKNKKYYSYRTLRKDRENIVSHDIHEIITKLSMCQKSAQTSSAANKRKSPLSIIDMFRNQQSVQKAKLGVNSLHFFEQDQQEMMFQKGLKK